MARVYIHVDTVLPFSLIFCVSIVVFFFEKKNNNNNKIEGDERDGTYRRTVPADGIRHVPYGRYGTRQPSALQAA